ncbi:MAG: acyl-CoA dehydrogenase [Lautropia sp.]|mgnify:FL=1|nr:MAG: acyl-CoA dehydrogenase [Pseudomonadota bacterium]MBC6959391.1 acyl-CoA dehydrogenase [Lautropia sp.]MDL1907725.1 acyl-CoA dehydrogenase [Betaproteobacteria bacterium PRO1]RIK86543.1 MAG: acyl-CoA dehydrogenase [Burkholderiales bacterium]
MSYVAPLKDMLFVLRHLAGIDEVASLPGFAEAGYDTAQAVLEECAKFNEQVVAPLNRDGDLQPATLRDGAVTTSPGFGAAFRQFADGGWQGIQHPEEFGGQGLPKLIATPCMEILNAANLSFALCPLLTDGAIEALLVAGSQAQKELYIPNLVSGAWTGTMNLTEPQAGSDLALVRTKAVPQADGSHRIFGQKIFITYGEHDMAGNIVHLVLARTPDAPEGVKGISLFVVPKFLVDEQGRPGRRNDVWCQSIEHKLGIKASPTAVLIYGDDKGEVGAGAIGYLIGEENRGLEYMFVMMNAARFAVGVQGVAVAERAYQQAVAYARERLQSRDVAGSSGAVPIIRHPDVRRMLMTMRAHTEAARALAFVAAAASDAGHRAADEAIRRENMAIYEFLVPIVKGWSTEMSLEVTSLGVQVHGGMGFIEETGAAQHYRDARILTIYEGTTAIQANDLIGRKTARNGGAVARALLARVRETEEQLARAGGADLPAIAARLSAGRAALEDAVQFVVDTIGSDVRAAFAGSVPYLKLAGVVLSGWQMARAALAAERMLKAGEGDAQFLQAKIATARFHADHLLTQAGALRAAATEGAAGVLAMPEAAF